MMSWMHQLMSQWNQMGETTPGHSQKPFKTPETVNLTEKNEISHQRHNRQHNDGKVNPLGSLIGLPAELSNGIAVQINTKTTIKITYKDDFLMSKLAVWVHAQGTEPTSAQQLWHLSIENIIWIDLNFMITT